MYDYQRWLHRNNDRPASELALTAKVNLRRSGIESKLVYPSGPTATVHTRSITALQKALLNSLEWNEVLVSGEIDSFEALIRRDNLNGRQTHRLRKLAFLAPDIIERIIAGEIPDTLTLERLEKGLPPRLGCPEDTLGSQSSQP